MNQKPKTEQSTSATATPGRAHSNTKSFTTKPMASKKLSIQCFKLLKDALKFGKTNIMIGMKDVTRGIQIGVRGIVLLAGDQNNMDMYTLSGKCVGAGIPYVYVPSKLDIKSVLGVKRSCATVLIKFRPEYKELFEALAYKLECLPK